jgi:hypothetical protein
MTPGETVAADLNFNYWQPYMKYNNGRFFANLEYSWITVDVYKTLNGGPALASSVPAPEHQLYQHAFAEAGLLCGPSKLTFMWAWSPGQNLAANTDPTLTGVHTTNSRVYPINSQAMAPYNTLMFQTYAGGNNEFNSVFTKDGVGCMGDAWALGSRLDYAVASNLNVWGTYLWAERLERDGYYAGQFGGYTPPLLDGLVNVNGNVPNIAAGSIYRGTYGGTDPFAGNKFLGWEADAGVDWKLLEGLTVHATYAYWQPGDWFDWAYQAIVPTAGGGVTVAPQGKSAIQSVQGSFLVDF